MSNNSNVNNGDTNSGNNVNTNANGADAQNYTYNTTNLPPVAKTMADGFNADAFNAQFTAFVDKLYKSEQEFREQQLARLNTETKYPNVLNLSFIEVAAGIVATWRRLIEHPSIDVLEIDNGYYFLGISLLLMLLIIIIIHSFNVPSAK